MTGELGWERAMLYQSFGDFENLENFRNEAEYALECVRNPCLCSMLDRESINHGNLC